MPVRVFCQGCKKTYRVKDEFVGKRGKCPQGHMLTVPATDAVETAVREAPSIGCPDLKSRRSLPTGVQEQTPFSSSNCQSCGAKLPTAAVLCMHCVGSRPRASNVARARDRKPNRQKIVLLGGIGAGVVIVATTLCFSVTTLFYLLRPTANSIGFADHQRASADRRIKSTQEATRLKSEQEREAQFRTDEAQLEAEAVRVENERLARLEHELREKEEQARLEKMAREQEKSAAEEAERKRKELELANRPPTVAIVRTSPEKPRSGGSFVVQLQGQHPQGEAVTFQYRSSGEGDWTDTAGDAVSLADLQPGELRLEVRSRDKQGLTSEPLTQDWVVPPVKVKNEPTRKYKGHGTCSHGVTFTPDGQKFLSGSCDMTLKLWDTVDPNFLVEFKGVRGQIFAVDITSDGKYAVTGGRSADGKRGLLQLWDMETYKEVRQLSGHTNTVTCVKFSPEGTFLASGSRDGTVVIWDVQTGREVRTLKEAGSSVMAVAFSDHGSRLLSAGTLNGEGAIRQWDLDKGELLTQIVAPSRRVTSVAFLNEVRMISSSGRVFASETIDVDSHVRVWDLEMKRESGSFLGNQEGVSSLALSFDRKYVFCASGDGTMQLREVEGGGEVQRYEGHKKKVLCIAISRNSHYVVTGSEDGQLLLWDLPREVHIPEEPQ